MALPPTTKQKKISRELPAPVHGVEIGGDGVRHEFSHPTLADVLDFERATGIEWGTPQAWFSRLGLAGYVYMATNRTLASQGAPGRSWDAFMEWYHPEDAEFYVDDDEIEEADDDPPADAEAALEIVGDASADSPTDGPSGASRS